MLEGPFIVLAHRIVVHPEFVETLIPKNDPSAIHDSIAMALGHRVQPLGAALVRLPVNLGLIQVKEEGWTGFSVGWQGCAGGFPKGKTRGKSQGAARPARGKPRPSRLYYLDLHSI